MKYSEVFIEFARPLEGITPSDISTAEFEKLLRPAETAWNAVVFDEVRGTNHVNELLDTIPTDLPWIDRERMIALLNFWIDRKKNSFSKYKWPVTVKVKWNKARSEFRIIAITPGKSFARGQ